MYSCFVKNAKGNCRIFLKTYGQNILMQEANVHMITLFKSGNFALKDKEFPGQPRKFEAALFQ